MPVNIRAKIGSKFPVLSAYMQSRDRHKLIRGPRASAKTFSTAQCALMLMAEQEPNERGIRPTRGIISRFSYGELMSTTVKDWLSVFADMGTFRYGHAGPPTWESHAGLYLDDGSQIQAEALFQSSGVDDVEDTFKGFQTTWSWFNELSGAPKLAWDTADASLGRYPSVAAGGVPCTQKVAMGDTNSFDESHWLFPFFANPPRGYAVFNQPGGVFDSGEVGPDGRKVWKFNPAAECYIPDPASYYLDLCAGYDDDKIKVLLANEYGFHVDGKPVHPEYIDSRHCAANEIEPDKRYPIILGIDFGRTPCAAFLQHFEATDQWICFDEMPTENMSAALFAPQLKRYLDRRYAGFRVVAYGDPAGDSKGQATEDTPIQIMRAGGIPCRPAPSNVTTLRRAALANPLTRISWVSKREAFLLSPRCKMIRKGLMGGFCYRRMRIPGAEDRFTEEPEKNQYSHPVEALEYGLLGGGEGRAALMPAEPQPERGWRQETAEM